MQHNCPCVTMSQYSINSRKSSAQEHNHKPGEIRLPLVSPTPMWAGSGIATLLGPSCGSGNSPSYSPPAHGLPGQPFAGTAPCMTLPGYQPGGRHGGVAGGDGGTARGLAPEPVGATLAWLPWTAASKQDSPCQRHWQKSLCCRVTDGKEEPGGLRPRPATQSWLLLLRW